MSIHCPYSNAKKSNMQTSFYPRIYFIAVENVSPATGINLLLRKDSLLRFSGLVISKEQSRLLLKSPQELSHCHLLKALLLLLFLDTTKQLSLCSFIPFHKGTNVTKHGLSGWLRLRPNVRRIQILIFRMCFPSDTLEFTEIAGWQRL